MWYWHVVSRFSSRLSWCALVSLVAAGCARDPILDPDDGSAVRADATDVSALSPDARDSSAAQDAQPTTDGSERVCERDIPREGAYRATRGEVYFGDERVRLWGLNWFGLETPDRAPHGLWMRSLDFLLDRVRALGFNALRLPLSPESIRPGFRSASWAIRGDTDTGREQLEAVIDGARQRGMRVLLSFHTCNPAQLGGSLPGSPTACGGYSESEWTADLERMASLATQYFPTVVGVDLVNEPHALRWSDWRELARRGGSAVLCREPRVLVFVEGVGNASTSATAPAYWGKNFTEASLAPVELPASRLVYSPHVYGPSVADMGYFHAADFPRNLAGVWQAHFGHLLDAGHNVIIGEFGGHYDDARARGDVAWHDALVTWMLERGARDFFYWALNPNSGDTGGVLMDDWSTPNERKVALLRWLMQP